MGLPALGHNPIPHFRIHPGELAVVHLISPSSSMAMPKAVPMQKCSIMERTVDRAVRLLCLSVLPVSVHCVNKPQRCIHAIVCRLCSCVRKTLGSSPSLQYWAKEVRISQASSNLPVTRVRPSRAIIVSLPQSPNQGSLQLQSASLRLCGR